MASVLDRFLPMNVISVQPGYGSFFTIDMASNTGARRSLWVYLCGWAILRGGNGALTSDNPKAEIDDYLLRFWSPQKLLSAKMTDKIEIDFCFDNSRLRLFPYPETYGVDADLFRLFDQDKIHYLRFADKEIKEGPSGELQEGRVNTSN